ncbi:MAG: polymer-forming cytoskeletal protein [Anaerolineales bacterium]|nr:MAG: polymer-forming cytoskeletal protein [Anaerolineales bacterium]
MKFKTSIQNKWGRLAILALVIVGFLTLAYAGSAQAAEVVTGDPDAVVAAGVVIDDDLIISGDNVVIDGTITGNLFATGIEVVLNGSVEGSVFIAGELLTINGDVGGSLYSGGCAITLGPQATISRSIYAGGFSLVAENGSHVGHGIHATVFQNRLNGEVGKDVEVVTGAFEFNGSAGGNVDVELGETCSSCLEFVPVEAIQPGLRIADDSRVGGELSYKVTTTNFESVDANNVEIQPMEVDFDELRNSVLRFIVVQEIRRAIGEFISLLIVGGLLVYFLEDRVQSVMGKISAGALSSFGWGLLVVLLFPLALLVAIAVLISLTLVTGFITLGQLSGTVMGLGGLTIASFVIVFVFVLSLVTKAVFAYMVGKFVLGRISQATLESRWGDVRALVTGVLIYEIVRVMPVLGWLAALVVILIGAGAILGAIRDTLRPSVAIA